MAKARRAALRSLSDVEKQQSLLYREARNGLISGAEMNNLSQLLHRLHQEMCARQSLDIDSDLLALEERLTKLQERA